MTRAQYHVPCPNLCSTVYLALTLHPTLLLYKSRDILHPNLNTQNAAEGASGETGLKLKLNNTLSPQELCTERPPPTAGQHVRTRLNNTEELLKRQDEMCRLRPAAG